MTTRWTVCLGVMLLLLTSTAARADEAARGDCDAPNIQMPGLYRSALQPLVERSATLRRQCDRIADTPFVRVTIEPARDLTGFRARSRVTRSASGGLDVVVELPLGRDLAELMAHELEHVLEQIEGLNLAQRARDGGSGVRQVGDDAFETVRAQRAGQLAAIEAVTRRPVFESRAIPPARRVMAD